MYENQADVINILVYKFLCIKQPRPKFKLFSCSTYLGIYQTNSTILNWNSKEQAKVVGRLISANP